MTWPEILNIALGGGLLTLLAGVLTLRSTVRKAEAEATRARADAETVRITNTESATRILVDNIVKPLKEELNATREDLQANKREMASTKREMARLRKAVEAASGCPHSDRCPVLFKLQDNPKRREGRGGDRMADGAAGQRGGDDKGGDQRAGLQERGVAPYLGRQPPETA